jgi:ABC-type nickel/cobalt efflux system permease component RcnA
MGIASALFSLKANMNVPMLIFTSVIISYLLTNKLNRYLTKTEIVAFTLGAFAIVLVIRLGTVLFVTRNTAWITNWSIWVSLLIDFIGLFFFFGYFPNKFISKLVIEASEKKTFNQQVGEDVS